MILEHEIPEGSRLHFGPSARLKRRLENLSVEVFYKHGFEEMASPTFVYQEHQRSFLERDVIRLSSEENHQIALRNDSTIDIIRIATKRLGRSTNQKKWFYIQPVFSYPTMEHNQIGAECLEHHEIQNLLDIGLEIFNAIDLKARLQLTNTKISKLCALELGMDSKAFSRLDISSLQNIDFVKRLLAIDSKSELEAALPSMPGFIKSDLEKLIQACECDYPNIICSPLLPAPVDYYDDLFFRLFLDNETFLSGGLYVVGGTRSCGFGIYTDRVVHYLLQKLDSKVGA